LFDKFAPISPVLVLRKVIPNPSKLHLTTRVNGNLRQETRTDNLIFGVCKIIQHMSRGKTLQPRTVIMTGSPAGVGWFMNPSGLLKGGNVVEVTIDKIGSIKNKMIFEP
jgi:transcription initiation factor TFIIH subunit 2